MTSNINDIVSAINKNFFARPYRYEVRIFGNGGNASQEVMLNCASVNVPGINIGFGANKPYGIGLQKFYPQGKSFTELSMTFYETEFEMERKFFVDWMNQIYNDQTNRFAYYNDVIRTVTIIQYDKKDKVTYECDCLEVFPSNISPLDKSYASGDIIPTFTVNLQFHKIKEKFKTKEAPSLF